MVFKENLSNPYDDQVHSENLTRKTSSFFTKNIGACVSAGMMTVSFPSLMYT